MKGRKKRKTKYKAEYKESDLNLKLERINLRIDLDDHLEVGLFMSKFREAGLGSSRELGRLFRRSPSTVINKDRFGRMSSKSLIDGRGQKKRYKIEEIKEEILYVWAKNPMASDKEIHQELQPRLSSLDMRLDLKTLTRFIRDAGIDEVRSRLRREAALAKRGVVVPDNNGRVQDNFATEGRVKEKEIIQTYSRYAGQMLHIPHLYQMNFPRMINGLPSPPEKNCVYSRERVCHQIYFLYAMQEERLYDLDSIAHGEFGALIVMRDNLRSSGMNKRVKRMATPDAIEVFQKEALAGRSGLISRKDMELCYCDTHVIEVWP